MKKKICIISFIIILSFIAASAETSFITKPDMMIFLLSILLGLCFIAYMFLCNQISEMVKKYKINDSEHMNEKLNELIKELEENINFIIIAVIIIIVCDFLYNYNIPLVKDAYNLNLSIIYIYSLKDYIFKFIISICSGLSFYAFYDVMSAIFKILRAKLLRIKIHKRKKVKIKTNSILSWFLLI